MKTETEIEQKRVIESDRERKIDTQKRGKRKEKDRKVRERMREIYTVRQS